MLFYHVKHSRINPPSVPVEFKQRIHRLLIILIISGDISLNPGPVKNPCGLCAKPVAKITVQFYAKVAITGGILNVVRSHQISTKH
jgi:hypothetical protein